MGEMQPATCQRQLALMAQLAGVRFDANRSLAEQISGNLSRNKNVCLGAPTQTIFA